MKLKQNPHRQQAIAKRLRKLRRDRKLKQQQIADALGISWQRWHNYETGVRSIDVDIVCSVADRFDVTTDWLLRGS